MYFKRCYYLCQKQKMLLLYNFMLTKLWDDLSNWQTDWFTLCILKDVLFCQKKDAITLILYWPKVHLLSTLLIIILIGCLFWLDGWSVLFLRWRSTSLALYFWARQQSHADFSLRGTPSVPFYKKQKWNFFCSFL
jgi:hypothetical protein